MLYGRDGDRILLHGSIGAGALRHVAAGAPAALCVTHLDGWVYAHTLFDSSANYRSAPGGRYEADEVLVDHEILPEPVPGLGAGFGEEGLNLVLGLRHGDTLNRRTRSAAR